MLGDMMEIGAYGCVLTALYNQRKKARLIQNGE